MNYHFKNYNCPEPITYKEKKTDNKQLEQDTKIKQ